MSRPQTEQNRQHPTVPQRVSCVVAAKETRRVAWLQVSNWNRRSCHPLRRRVHPMQIWAPTCYRLRGVVNHLGVTASGGHFLTDILDPEADRWLRCDDSLVTDVSYWNHFSPCKHQDFSKHLLRGYWVKHLACVDADFNISLVVTGIWGNSFFGNVREAYMFFYVHEAAGSKASVWNLRHFQ